jgi:sarcosine oxidase subunit beta
VSPSSSGYDALVVGAGYIGCAAAYYLALAGLRTALLDREGIGSGASRANYGNVQMQDAELDHSLPLTLAGVESWRHVEEELGCDVGYRRLGSLLVIETPEQWETLSARLPRLHAAGIRAEMVAAKHLGEIEPLLDTRAVLGACYHPDEGQVWPSKLMHAYVERGRAHGLEVHRGTTVTGFRLNGGRLAGVNTVTYPSGQATRGELSAGTVVLTTGAWTPDLGRLLDRKWDIQHVHGQALVTEASPLRLRNHLSSAAFFDSMHVEEGRKPPAAVMAISQSASGHFLLGEAGVTTTDLGKRTTPGGQAAVAAETLRFLPALAKTPALRGWAAPVAFTADGLPYLGPVAGLPGLILATAFKSTVIVTPVAGRLAAQLALGGRTELDLTPFSPDRAIAHTA